MYAGGAGGNELCAITLYEYAGGAGRDAPCTTLYAEGDAPCVTLYAGGDAPCVPLYAETLFRNFHCGSFLVTIDPSPPSQPRRQGRLFEQPATTQGKAQTKTLAQLHSLTTINSAKTLLPGLNE